MMPAEYARIRMQNLIDSYVLTRWLGHLWNRSLGLASVLDTQQRTLMLPQLGMISGSSPGGTRWRLDEEDD
jgi:hypothetical protein